MFDCVLSVYHLRSHIWILGSCFFTLGLRCYRTHNEIKMVSNQHIVNTNMSWTHASTNLQGLCPLILLLHLALLQMKSNQEITWVLLEINQVSCTPESRVLGHQSMEYWSPWMVSQRDIYMAAMSQYWSSNPAIHVRKKIVSSLRFFSYILYIRVLFKLYNNGESLEPSVAKLWVYFLSSVLLVILIKSPQRYYNIVSVSR